MSSPIKQIFKQSKKKQKKSIQLTFFALIASCLERENRLICAALQPIN